MTCPNCKIEYHQFKTGFTFADIYDMFWTPNPDPNQWRYKRRNTILGKWREIKLSMWERHLETCKGNIDSNHYGFVEY